MNHDRRGVSVCRGLRSGNYPNKAATVIMLTARDGETSVVVGLEVGADDYVTKPFRPTELVSRVRAHLRRQRIDSSAAEQTQELEFPGLEVDLLRREVTSGGEQVSLNAKEFEVLSLLASTPGRVYSREQIMRHLWDGNFFRRGACGRRPHPAHPKEGRAGPGQPPLRAHAQGRRLQVRRPLGRPGAH